MNKFFAFFALSLLLHLAIGALFLSRSGLWGKGEKNKNLVLEETEELDTAEMAEEETESALNPVEEKTVKPKQQIKKPLVTKKKPSKPKKTAVTTKPHRETSKKSPAPIPPLPSPEEKQTSGEDEQQTKNVSSSPPPSAPAKAEEDQIIEPKPKALPALHKQKAPKTHQALSEKEGEKSDVSELAKNGSHVIPALNLADTRFHSRLKQKEGNPLPIYPSSALKNKWEGRVEIFYYVNPAGFVEKIQLGQSSGHSVLDNSALRALARYRYYPGQEGWVRHPVEFFLELDKEVMETATLGGNDRAPSSQTPRGKVRFPDSKKQ